jgi:phosphatidylethanolamine/phosphatidyl-N-methylethanolamine N-methyltransferase
MSLSFFLEFLRHPFATGAIAPSSRFLARAMVTDMDLGNASVVVEYGPGTGAFTGAILQELKPGARYFAVEQNAAMVAHFRKRFPHVQVFENSVADMEAIVRAAGSGPVDCILCGLPWASFGDELQDRLLGATLSVLREGGRFATFAYVHGALLLPSGRSFGRKLARLFSATTRSRTVWRNLPPAFVYRCIK